MRVDELLHSVARYLAGLDPKWRSARRFYFEKHAPRAVEKVRSLKERASGRRCPFCGRRFSRASGFVNHLLRLHRPELEAVVHEHPRAVEG